MRRYETELLQRNTEALKAEQKGRYAVAQRVTDALATRVRGGAMLRGAAFRRAQDPGVRGAGCAL